MVEEAAVAQTHRPTRTQEPRGTKKLATHAPQWGGWAAYQRHTTCLPYATYLTYPTHPTHQAQLTYPTYQPHLTYSTWRAYPTVLIFKSADFVSPSLIETGVAFERTRSRNSGSFHSLAST